MNIVGRWIRRAFVISEDAQFAPPQPPKPRIKGYVAILVSPGRDRARLVPQAVAEHFYDHMDRAILPHGGEVRIFRTQEAWGLAVEIIDRIERLDDIADKPYSPHYDLGA